MFDKHFEVLLADTTEGKNIHYSIRYQVYCEEMEFENKEDFPEQMEFDEDDDRSIHFIVRNKLTSQWVGAMRLINKQNNLLPIEKNCTIDEEIKANDLFGVVELSRLCLIKEVRKGFKDINPPLGIVDESILPKESDKVKLMPCQHKFKRRIIWEMFHAAAEYGYLNNIQHCYFMTTSALAKVLRRSGLNLLNVGDPCQHKGMRHPFKMNADEAYRSDVWKGDSKTSYRLFSEWRSKQYQQSELVA